MKSFITIKEATLLTGKAEITIRRLIRRARHHDYAGTGQMIRQEKTSSGFVYTLDKELLSQAHLLPAHPTTLAPGHDHPMADQVSTSPPATADAGEAHSEAEAPAHPEEPSHGQSPTHGHSHRASSATAGDQPLFQALADTIEVLKDQLATKDHQIEVKDQQIDRLIKDRERSDVLLKNLQDRVYLIPPHDPADYPDDRGSPSAPDTSPPATVVVQANVIPAHQTSSRAHPPHHGAPPPRTADRTRPAPRSASRKGAHRADKLLAQAGQGIALQPPAAIRLKPWWRPW